MERRVVITGVGLITPGGDLAHVWDTLLDGQSMAQHITSFDASVYLNDHAGIIDETDAFSPFSSRLLKRMDRFGCLTMAAAHQALQDSGLDIDLLERSTVGTYIGNMYGGWGITDPSLRRLLIEGYREVSPYVASAWFPTAPQGQIAIHWGFKGFGKTVIADTASSALSIGYAARAIQEGRANVMIAGGAESPITPYTYTFCERSGRVSPNSYQVFDAESSGFLVGEGAVLVVLEEMEAALQRHAHIYAEIAGWATGYLPQFDTPWHDEGKRFTRLIWQALEDAKTPADDIDYIGLDAQGCVEADNSEALALERVFGAVSSPAATTCKPVLTHLLGAAAAAELVTALLAMQQNIIPPVTASSMRNDALSLNLIAEQPRQVNVQTALINARGADGVQAAIVLKKVQMN